MKRKTLIAFTRANQSLQLLWLLMAICLVAGGWSALAQDDNKVATNSNAAFIPQGNIVTSNVRVHDPVMIKEKDTYYVFCTGRGVSALKSKNMKDWERMPSPLTPLPWHKADIPEQNGSFWAPDIHYRDGKYHLYYSVSAWMNFNSSIGYATNTTLDPDDPSYKWEDHGKVIDFRNGGKGVNCIDPNIFVDTDGKVWLLYGSYRTGLRLVELNPKTGKLFDETNPDVTVLTTSLGEGVFLLKSTDGYYYIFASRGRCCAGVDSTYQVVMGRSRDIKGPYLTKTGESWMDNRYSLLMVGDYDEPGRGHNGFFTEDTTTYILYHAYNREANGTSLLRISPLCVDEEGWPSVRNTGKLFENAMISRPPADKPLFVDPVYDGAADPVVIWNRAEKKWFMLYTNRRANVRGLEGVSWVHGTRIGIAESSDGGATWKYRGTCDIRYNPDADDTHWAPDVVYHEGLYHMYLTYVPGVFTDWNHPRNIVHLTSTDLLHWDYQSTLKLASDRVIDASVFRLPNGTWRMYYNNERDRKTTYYADSPDLYNWTDYNKRVLADDRGEGVKVFHWKDTYWMLIDAWDGLAVYSSPDLENWKKQSKNILKEPGTGKADGAKGQHCDVVVNQGRAFVFYFVHQNARITQLQVAELEYDNGELTCDRNKPVDIDLQPE